MGSDVKRIGGAGWGGALLLATLGTAAPAATQSAVVSVQEENFRAEPRGNILAELREGTPLRLGEDRGEWREATLEAWIWGPSVQDQQHPVLDLIVNAGGENLRAEPNGELLGRALGGMRLERLETRDRWIRVRRSGWIWAASIESVGDRAPGADDAPAAVETPAAAADPPADRSAPPARPARTDAPAYATATGGTLLLDTPAGDTLARVQPGTSVEVLDTDGDWTRVRIEGWTFTGSLVAGDSAGAEVLRDLSRDSLQAHPDRYRGRVVEWSIQFIAIQDERLALEEIGPEAFGLLDREELDRPFHDASAVAVGVGLERVPGQVPQDLGAGA
ncbi:MAG: hypothetical protein P8177_02260, partial [Gemmatimonadota bacterium]